MRQMEATIAGVTKLNGFTDVYEIQLDVPELYNTYVSNLTPVKIYVGPERIETYKRLYMSEEKFIISLP